MKRPTERFARRTVATTVALASLVAFAALAGVGLSQVVTSGPLDSTPGGSTSSSTPGSTTDQTGGSTTTANGKFVICHKTHSKKHPAHTITVAPAAWPAHKAQGDHMGACTDAEMHPTTTTSSTTTSTTSGTETNDSGQNGHKQKPKHNSGSNKKHGGGKGNGGGGHGKGK